MCVEKINVKFHKMTSYTFSVEARKKLACRYEERVSPKSKNVILLEPLNELASTCLIFFLGDKIVVKLFITYSTVCLGSKLFHGYIL